MVVVVVVVVVVVWGLSMIRLNACS